MAQAGRLEVVGGPELRKTLKAAGDSLQDLKQTHMDVAAIVVPRARALVAHKTGALSNTIRPGATARAAVIRAGSKRVPYAGSQEWGWGRRNIAQHAFLSPAARETESVWTATYKTRVDEILSHVHGK